MSNQLIWSYLIHLSTHMWGDATALPRKYFESGYSEANYVDMGTWDNTVKFLGECKYTHLLIDVGDAVRYESHPEISAPDAWDKDFLKKKLDEIRALGMTPIPKLNFSTCHDTWLKGYSRMISTPEYYRVCADLIREVAEVFGWPELFHLGFDEEDPQSQAGFVEMCVVRAPALWWHDLGFLAGECEKHGARPWIWSDYYWSHKDLFVKNMSKSILQSNWYYGKFQDYTPEDIKRNLDIQVQHAYIELDELGFDQVPTGSTWLKTYNTHQTVAFAKEHISPTGLKGFMTAPWYFTKDQDRYRLMDDAYRLYLARKAIYPETL